MTEETNTPAVEANSAPADGSGAVREIEGMLEAELAAEKQRNRNSLLIGAVMCAVVGGYLLWANSQFNKVLDPQTVAQVAAGVALDAIPTGTKAMRQLVVEGAPGMAAEASAAVVDLIPAYRMTLQAEIQPIIDESAATLANAWAAKLLANTETGKPFADDAARAAAATALVDRVKGLLDAAMDEPLQETKRTPRQTIEHSLKRLRKIDRGLRRIASKRGDPRERDLLLGWIGIVSRYQ